MKNAPKLKFNKPKSQDGITYMLPQETVDKIFSKIDGQKGNAIKLMVVLLGTKEGFAPSVKWLCDRTGMQRNSYYRARDYLIELGLIKVDDDKIIVNI